MPPRSKVERIPKQIRDELDRRLVDGGFQGYRELAAWLGEQGFHLSHQNVGRYASKLERRLDAIKLATAQARAIVEASPDDDGKINEALMRLVQQHLFWLLVDLERKDAGGKRKVEAKRKLGELNLGRLARVVSEMARTQVMHRRFIEETRATVAARIDEAGRQVRVITEKAGLSPEAEAGIRKALMEIAV